MAYLEPYFEYDVFVSYSHGDPSSAGDSPLKRWTNSLIRELKAEVQSVDTEFDRLHVWLDAQIDPTADLTEELRGKVKSSGILMIIMSPRYLKSSWCKDELEWFREQVRDRSSDQGRMFVIRALATNENDWPDFLRDERGNSLIGFRFHDPLSKMPFGWREVRENGEEYVRQLWTLQTALTKRLRELRERQETRATAQSAGASMPANEARRVYLHAQANQAPARNEVQRQLTEFGITPLSAAVNDGNALTDWTRETRARFETAKRCDALALIRSDEDEGFIGDLLDVGVDERERIQSARGKPLPCAVLDQSGVPLPIDVSAYGIQRFDLGSENWRGEFRTWLDDARASGARTA
jgi:hypothetical protein